MLAKGNCLTDSKGKGEDGVRSKMTGGFEVLIIITLELERLGDEKHNTFIRKVRMNIEYIESECKGVRICFFQHETGPFLISTWCWKFSRSFCERRNALRRLA